MARCRECAGRNLSFDTARAAVAYQGAAKSLIRAWKEHAVRRAADYATGLIAAQVERPSADVITYIPPDPVRQLARGGHPAQALARGLAEVWGLEALPLLARARPTSARQAHLARVERLRNARGAFVAQSAVGGRVVLVDDVYTTGATADAAARALKKAGAATVTAVSLARTVR